MDEEVTSIRVAGDAKRVLDCQKLHRLPDRWTPMQRSLGCVDQQRRRVESENAYGWSSGPRRDHAACRKVRLGYQIAGGEKLGLPYCVFRKMKMR